MLVGAFVVYKSVYNVPGGHRAIKYNEIHGLGQKVYDEGLNLLIPFIERPIIFYVGAMPFTQECICSSKDLYAVKTTTRVIYRPDVTKLPYIYNNLGPDYA